MARWVVALGTLAATATAFKTLDKDDYDVNYRDDVYGGKVVFEQSLRDTQNHEYSLIDGDDLDNYRKQFTDLGDHPLYVGLPMDVANDEAKTTIVGMREEGVRATNVLQDTDYDEELAGRVMLNTVKNGKYSNAFTKGTLPLSAAGEQNEEKTVIDQSFNYYSAKGTASQHKCKINIGKAVAISDDGLTFAFACETCDKNAGAAYGACTNNEHGIVGIGKWSGTEWDFVYIDPAVANSFTSASADDKTFGDTIALSGNGKVLFIGDPGSDAVYTFKWSATDPTTDKCGAAGNGWEENCHKVDYKQHTKLGYWYGANGDALKSADTINFGGNDVNLGDGTDFAMALSTDATGSYLAVAGMTDDRAAPANDDFGIVIVFKKKQTLGWFHGDKAAAPGTVRTALDKTATDAQVVFLQREAQNTGLGINVALSADAKYVAFADPDKDEDGSIVTDAGTLYLCKISTTALSEQGVKECQHAYGDKDERIGKSRNGLDISADGKIVVVGVPESDQEHRRRRTLKNTALEHDTDHGHIMFTQWDDKEDSAVLLSYAHKGDMTGTTDLAKMGYSVRCDEDCDRVVANDAYQLTARKRSEPSDDDGLTTGQKWAIGLGVGLGGSALLATGYYGSSYLQAGATAPMGYAAANGNSVL